MRTSRQDDAYAREARLRLAYEKLGRLHYTMASNAALSLTKLKALSIERKNLVLFIHSEENRSG